MKLTALALALPLIAFSGFSEAKINYVTGVVTSVDANTKQISITEESSGEVKTYSYHEKARIKDSLGFSESLSNLQEGEAVTLKVNTLEAAK